MGVGPVLHLCSDYARQRLYPQLMSALDDAGVMQRREQPRVEALCGVATAEVQDRAYAHDATPNTRSHVARLK